MSYLGGFRAQTAIRARNRNKRAARRLIGVLHAEMTESGRFVKEDDDLTVEAFCWHVLGFDDTAKRLLSLRPLRGLVLPSWFGGAMAAAEARGREQEMLDSIRGSQ